MRNAAAILACALLLCVLAPGAATAQDTRPPPGNSEADQYSETIPDDRGEDGIDRGEGAEELDSGEPGGEFLSPRELEELAEQGPDGRAAAELAAAGAPEDGEDAREDAKGAPGGSSDGSDRGGGSGSSGGTDDVGVASSDEQGLGVLFPILLAALALAALTFALLRRRTPAAS